MNRMAAAMAVAVAVVGLVGCSSDSGGTDGAAKTSTTARNSAPTSTTAAGSTPAKTVGDPAKMVATDVQKALVAAGIRCAGTPKSYEKTSAPVVGADPLLLLGCNPGSTSVTLRIVQFANPEDRAKAMAAASDMLCSFGVQQVEFVAAGPWAILAEKDGEPVNDLVEKAGRATGVKPTVVACPTE